jgi:hypothetical protein
MSSDKVGGNDRRSYSSSQVDWLLNRAQDLLINNYVTLFEADSRRVNELATLHVKSPLQGSIPAIQASTASINNRTVYIYEANLGNLNFAHHSITRISGLLRNSNCDYKARGRYIDNDDIDDALENSFDLDEKSFLVNIGRSSVTVTGREPVSLYLYTLYPLPNSNVFVEYIKKPQRMSLGGYTYLDNVAAVLTECELPEILQSKLVETAVMLAYGNINDEAYQLKKDMVANN